MKAFHRIWNKNSYKMYQTSRTGILAVLHQDAVLDHSGDSEYGKPFASHHEMFTCITCLYMDGY